VTTHAVGTGTLLCGPGPSNAPPEVLEALARPLVGHLDPRFLDLLDATKARLRRVFDTRNRVTFPVSGTGSAGMEAVLVNCLEPGETVVVGCNGVFGNRIAALAERLGGTAIRVEAPWGRAVPLEALCEATVAHAPAILAVVHGETSTGVCQPLDHLADLAHEYGSLLLVDCVTSLGGAPLHLDDSQIDLAYSGTQKCLNCPPGLAPVSFSARAVEKFRARSTPVPSFYLDLGELLAYLDEDRPTRAYHHTAPVSMIAALHAALALVLEEGLEHRWLRHHEASARLIAGLEELGCPALVPGPERLPPLTTVEVPDGVDEAAVRRRLLEEHDIEIGAGLGPLAGRVWRIGLMGINAGDAVVDRLLDALRRCLRD